MEKPGSWNFNILPVSGANEIKYDTQFHFGRTLAIWAMTFDFSIINGSVVKLGKDNRLSTIPNVLQYFFGRTQVLQLAYWSTLTDVLEFANWEFYSVLQVIVYQLVSVNCK